MSSWSYLAIPLIDSFILAIYAITVIGYLSCHAPLKFIITNLMRKLASVVDVAFYIRRPGPSF